MVVEAEDAGHFPFAVGEQPEVGEAGLAVEVFCFSRLADIEDVFAADHGAIDNAIFVERVDLDGAGYRLTSECIVTRVFAKAVGHALGEGVETHGGAAFVVIEFAVGGEEGFHTGNVALVVGPPEEAVVVENGGLEGGVGKRLRRLLGLRLALARERMADDQAGDKDDGEVLFHVIKVDN